MRDRTSCVPACVPATFSDDMIRSDVTRDNIPIDQQNISDFPTPPFVVPKSWPCPSIMCSLLTRSGRVCIRQPINQISWTYFYVNHYCVKTFG